MQYSSDILIDKFPYEYDSKLSYVGKLASEVLKQNDIRSDDNFVDNISEDKELKSVLDMFSRVDGEAYIVKSVEVIFPIGARNHYFIINSRANILDIFSWAYPFLSYNNDLDIIMSKDDSSADIYRSNPYDSDFYFSKFSDENMPLILWATFRAIFKGNNIIGRNYKKDIDRIFKLYKREEDLSKRDVVSRTFAIAVKSLQKNGFIEVGTRIPTDKGIVRSLELEREWGKEETSIKFKHFEEILKQARG